MTLSPDAKLVTLHTVLTQPLEPVVWDIEGILPRQARCVVYGEWASFKSYILLDMALHLATGREWLQFPVPCARRVLYLDEEMNEYELRRRLKRLSLGMKLEPEDIPLQYLSCAGVRFDAWESRRLQEFLAKSQWSPEVIIMESMRRLMQGDENEASDVARYWTHLNELQRRLKATIVFSHHMSKPAPNADHQRAVRHRASGSTDILAGGDCGFAVTRDRAAGGTVTIEVVKQRSGMEIPRFQVVVQDDPRDPASPMVIDRHRMTPMWD